MKGFWLNVVISAIFGFALLSGLPAAADSIVIKTYTWVSTSVNCNVFQNGNTLDCNNGNPPSCVKGTVCKFTQLSPNPPTYACDCR